MFFSSKVYSLSTVKNNFAYIKKNSEKYKFTTGYFLMNKKIYQIEPIDMLTDDVLTNDLNAEIIIQYIDKLKILDEVVLTYIGKEYKSEKEIINSCKTDQKILYKNVSFIPDVIYKNDQFGIFDPTTSKLTLEKTNNIIENNTIDEFYGKLLIRLNIKKVEYNMIYNILKNKYIKNGDIITHENIKITILDIINGKKDVLYKLNSFQIVCPDLDYILWKTNMTMSIINIRIVSSDMKFIKKSLLETEVKTKLMNEPIHSKDIYDVYICGKTKFTPINLPTIDDYTVFKIHKNTKINFEYSNDICYILDDTSINTVTSISIITNDDKTLSIDNIKKTIINKNNGQLGFYPDKATEYTFEDFKFKIKEIYFTKDIKSSHIIQITESTQITNHTKNYTKSTISIDSLKNFKKNIEDEGIAGIDDIYEKILNEILIFKTDLVDDEIKNFVKPNKGIIFYGPPGTGKTSLARVIGKVLDIPSDNIQMLTGTEILNKYVGESEKLVRDLFKPAKDNTQGFFMIIIDEIDAILGQRGKLDNQMKDSIVNQFLGEMDGLKRLDNFLVIGITNRLELLDSAILRQGRFGCQIEISYPNRQQRYNIFTLYYNKLKKYFEDIDLNLVADITDKLVGADIEQVFCKCINKYLVNKLNNIDRKINMDDMIKVIQSK